jgi:hypothetical protein
MSHQHTAHAHEHEYEPQHGLPERLPADETILWQGGPDLRMLALRVFHLRKLAIYFAAMLVLRAVTVWAGGAGWGGALMSIAWLAVAALVGLGAVAALAWLTASTTVYTLTNKRVVTRIGIVLTVTFNLPLVKVASAALRPQNNGVGDICLALAGADRIAWLQLWPHVRPWRLAKPEPMLRMVPDAARVAGLLSTAWSTVNGLAVVSQDAAPARPAVTATVTTSGTAPGTATPWQVRPT